MHSNAAQAHPKNEILLWTQTQVNSLGIHGHHQAQDQLRGPSLGTQYNSTAKQEAKEAKQNGVYVTDTYD